ncbi:cytidine deaminase [Chelatococcus asaccharovorans]|uniref:cytidine deaminase n=1 Tax=Chelatococcus asaccharovorans TaxID=28210 RepID=UPI00224C715F|nr:cytidine deaminase [Chelatococcus asaccharovorans]CAH1650515.1 Cytidine deaminase [Chelatococcus asaccharovorans]CAH1686753.1 Cytidine deaminase [Chelatococcus asaccharovorans]
MTTVGGTAGSDVEALFAAASAACAHAYAPYSQFRVGAAVLTASGRVFAGANVENASYPAGLCAEAVAIGAMVAAGERHITAVMVVGEGDELTMPCGVCRQRLSEFSGADTPVHVGDKGGVRQSFRFGDLLPFAFGPSNLAR